MEKLGEQGLAIETLEKAIPLVDRHREPRYLAAEQTREVKELAREMAPVFQAQGVHREALAALRLFCQAAEKEAATLDLARRLVDYLERARHDPGLRFAA